MLDWIDIYMEVSRVDYEKLGIDRLDETNKWTRTRR